MYVRKDAAVYPNVISLLRAKALEVILVHVLYMCAWCAIMCLSGVVLHTWSWEGKVWPGT